MIASLAMDRGARVFWSIVIVLGSASTFFGVRAESVRRSVQRASAHVDTGDVVQFSKIIDGDTVLLVTASGDPVTVRLLGIKSFDTTSTKDPGAAWGRRANEVLRKALEAKPIRVMLATPAKDKHGRTIATLFVDDDDVALVLIREGLVLVYPVFPFPAMHEYMHEQEKAKNDHKGLWGDPLATERAQLLVQEWRKGGA
jgi:micrococcal nuclease